MKNKILAIIVLILSLCLSACISQQSAKTIEPRAAGQADKRMSKNILYQKKWQLNSLNSIVQESTMTKAYIRFFEDGRVSGFSGCNRFQGKLEIRQSQMKIGPLGSTRKACPNLMSYEAKVLKILRTTDAYEIAAERLELYSNGQHVATFQ